MKYKKIDHGKSMNIPKVSKEVDGILKFQRVHKSPPYPALFYQNMTLKFNQMSDEKLRMSDEAQKVFAYLGLLLKCENEF